MGVQSRQNVRPVRRPQTVVVVGIVHDTGKPDSWPIRLTTAAKGIGSCDRWAEISTACPTVTISGGALPR